MNELVEKLTTEQTVEVKLRPEPSLEHLREALERRHVHVLFPDTEGGTELGVPLDEEASDLDTERDPIRLEGELTLDYSRVRFVGEIRRDDLRGTGRLVHLEDVDPGGAAAAAG